MFRKNYPEVMTPELRKGDCVSGDDPSGAISICQGTQEEHGKCFNRARLLALNSRNNNNINRDRSKYLYARHCSKAPYNTEVETIIFILPIRTLRFGEVT